MELAPQAFATVVLGPVGRKEVRLLVRCRYDPRAMVDVMRELAAAGEPDHPLELFRTHPDPDLRIRQLEAAIVEEYPLELPAGLRQ